MMLLAFAVPGGALLAPSNQAWGGGRGSRPGGRPRRRCERGCSSESQAVGTLWVPGPRAPGSPWEEGLLSRLRWWEMLGGDVAVETSSALNYLSLE